MSTQREFVREYWIAAVVSRIKGLPPYWVPALRELAKDRCELSLSRENANRFSSKNEARFAARDFHRRLAGEVLSRDAKICLVHVVPKRKADGASLVGFDDVQFPVAHTYPDALADQWAQTEAVKVKLRNAVHAARRWRMLANAYRNNAASPLVVACLPDGLRCPTCGGKLVGL